MAKIKLNQGRKGNEKTYDYHYEKALQWEIRWKKLSKKEQDDELRAVMDKIGPNRV